MSSGRNSQGASRPARKTRRESPPGKREKYNDARRTRSDHEKSRSEFDLSRQDEYDRKKKDTVIKTRRSKSPKRVKENFDRKPVGQRKDLKPKVDTKEKAREKKSAEVLERHPLFQDNSRLAQLIAQITNNNEEAAKRLTAAQSLVEYVYDPAHLEPVKRNCSNIFSALEEVFLDRGFNELKDKVVCCYASIGYMLGIDCDKFFKWVFSKIPSAPSDTLRVLYLRTISETVVLDAGKQVFYDTMPMIMASLQDVLENADAPELLLIILDVLVIVARDYPHIFAEYFRDTVDILVGWHIDTTQGNLLMQKTADCLVSLHPYWVSDMRFSMTLLGQFLEDMEAYAEELNGITNGKFSKEDTPSPYVALPKLTALTQVFTTVVSGLGEFFSPGREAKITAHYITETVDRIIACVDISSYEIKFEQLLIAANHCLSVLASSLGSSIGVSCKKLFKYINSQLEKGEITYKFMQSSLRLIEKVIIGVGQSLPFDVVSDLLNVDSPFMKLRIHSDSETLPIMLNILQTLLSMKNHQLLETIYKLFVTDLCESYKTLTSIEIPPQYTPDDYNTQRLINDTTVKSAHAKIAFSLAALAEIATYKSSVMGAWKVEPSTFSLLTTTLDPTNIILINHFPDIQFSMLSTLFCHSQRCNNFIPSSKTKTLAQTPESTALIKLLCKLLMVPQVCSDVKCLCVLWLSSISSSIAALPMDVQKRQWNLIPVIHSLTLSTYSFESKVREESANCIAKLTSLGFTHPVILGRLLVECLPHLLDTSKAMSEKFRKMVMTFPADLLASLPSNSCQQNKQKFIGSSESPFASSTYDLWLVCKKHMCAQPSGTLLPHSFKVIMSFLLAPQDTKHKNGWTEDVFNSAQRLGKHTEPVVGNLAAFQRFSTAVDATLPTNLKTLDGILWFWLSWEAASFCILARLKTPLGKALDTFQSIEGVLKGLEARFCEKMKASPLSKKMKSKQKDQKESNKEYLRGSIVVHQAVLLLQFLENLEKLMYNAYEGTSSSLPPANRPVRTFFRTNRGTCCEWLNRIQESVTILATLCGCPEKAVRSGYSWLQHLHKTGNTQGKEFEHAVVTVVDALMQLHCHESIDGILEWSRKTVGRHFFWLSGASVKAKGSLEAAADVFKASLTKYLSPDRLKSENVNEPKKATVTLLLKDPVINADPLSTQFLVGQATDCYLQLCDWAEVQEWNRHVNELQKKFSSVQGLYSTIDHSYVKAMMKFEEHDFAAVHEQLEMIPGANVASMLHEQFPVLGPAKDERDRGGSRKLQDEGLSTSLADNFTPQAMLCQSRIFLMQALTLYWTSGLNTLKGSKVGSLHSSEWETVEELLSESSDAAFTPLKSMLLNHTTHNAAPFLMQLKSIAAIRDALVATDSDQDADVTFMNVYGQKQYIDANKTDISILNEALRTTSYLQFHHSLHRKGWVGPTVNSNEKLPNVQTLQVMTAKMARKQGNKKLAESLLAKQLSLLESKGAIDGKMYLTGGAQLKLKQLSASVSSGKVVDPLAAVDILRESAKLKLTLGNSSEAIDVLCSSILLSERQLSGGNKSTSNAVVKLSEISARSFLTLAKWIYSENRVQSPVGDMEDTVTVGPKVREVVKISTKSCGSLSRVLQGGTLSMSNMSEGDAICGQLLFHSTFRCPSLGKTWFNFADWCYRWGRKTVEVESYSAGSFDLLKEEKDAISKILPNDTPASVISKVISVISTSVHARDSNVVDDESGLTTDEELNESDSEKVKRKLVYATDELIGSNSDMMESLLTLWQSVLARVYSHYSQAAVAYFTYLRLTGSESYAPPDVIKRSEYGNITATLRLLRLLVKYSGELKQHLEQSFTQTPTKSWRSIIPQLFARLNHPENYVASTVASLICRIAQDSAELIVYPTVVGCSDMMPQQQLTKTSAEGILRAYQYQDDDECEQPVVATNTQDELEVISQVDTEATNSQEEQYTISVEDKALLSSLHVILDTLNADNSTLVQEVKCVVSELRRITLLWDELWHGSLAQLHQEAQRRIQQLNSEIKRVNTNKTLSETQKSSLIREKHAALMKPEKGISQDVDVNNQLFFALERLYKITSQAPETPHEQNFQNSFGNQINKAIESLKNPIDPSNPERSWEPTKQSIGDEFDNKCLNSATFVAEIKQSLLYQTLQSRAQKRAMNSLAMQDISPILAKSEFQLIPLPGIVSPLDQSISLKGFSNDVQILPTKTKPKKLVMHASDGQQYAYLFKGLEDLHLDERIMQFLEICNFMFAKECKSGERKYFARHYSVTPLGPRSGLIQWVDGATPLFTLYRRWQQREAAANLLLKNQSDKSGSSTTTVVAPTRPTELFYNKISPLLKEKEKGTSQDADVKNQNIDTSVASRKDWPINILRKVLQELSNETPADLLSRELWCASTSASDWWSMTQSYSRSAAVMSVIGYVLGLGDRHLDNILIDLTTGEIVHIDYNVCFEKGKALRVPEKVPFRMTRNMETALGVTGVEGIFRSSCEKVMQFLRQGREILLTLLEAFVYDPLIDWTTANDAAFAGAFYGGGGIADEGNKLSRKEMERSITQTLLSTRIAEMRVPWHANKDELIVSLNKLKELLVSFCQTVNSQWYANEELLMLEHQASLLKAALVKPSHPLHSLQARYDKQAKLLSDLKHSKIKLKEKTKECDSIQTQFQTAYMKVCGPHIRKICDEINQLPDVGPPSFGPAVQFLNSAGQSNIVHQCGQLESELMTALSQRRSVLSSCVDTIISYVDVVHQFGEDYMYHHLLSVWIKLLSPLHAEPTSQHCHAVLEQHREIVSKKQTIQKDIEPLARTLENKLHHYYTEQNNKLKKLNERRNHDLGETSTLSGPVTETWNALRRFTGDAGLPGATSLACVTVTALSTLNKRQLVMENAAAVAGDRLMHLTSRDGDWFLDELCTMCGNISQLLSVLKNNALRLSPQKNTPHTEALDGIQTGMQVVFSAVKAYNSLQELISSFRAVIVPQTIQLFLSNNAMLFDVMDSVREVVESPSVSITSLIEEYERALLEKCDVSDDIAKIVANLHSRFDQCVEPLANTMNEEVEEEEAAALTVGQTLLLEFCNLFTKFENEVISLYESFRKLKQQDGFENIDLQLEQRNLKRSKQFFSAPTSRWLNLLFLKKLSIVQSFFDACLQQSGATRDIDNGMRAMQKLSRDSYNTNSKSGPIFRVFNEELLCLPVKQFIADGVQSYLIGIPSQALTSLSLSYIGLLAPTLARDVRDGKRNITTVEEICKKVVDYNLKSGTFPHNHLTQASGLINAHDTAWRKHDLARRLDLSIASQKEVVDRAQIQLARFQWLHEESLFSPNNAKTKIPSASPAKHWVINEIKKRLQAINQVEHNMTALMEKHAQLQASIEQRLKWGSGANPALNTVLHNFAEAVAERKVLIQRESNLTPEIHAIASAIIKMETFRTNVNDASIFDQTIVSYIQECEVACRTFETCMEDLGDVEQFMRSLQIPIPPKEPITLNWMKSRLATVETQMKSVLGRAPTVKSAILTEREILKGQISSCKTCLTSHHALVGEVKSMLKTLAKVRIRGVPGGKKGMLQFVDVKVQVRNVMNFEVDVLRYAMCLKICDVLKEKGTSRDVDVKNQDEDAEECWNVRRFIQAHNKFSEDSSVILKKILNMASTSRSDATEEITRLNEEEASTIEIMINELVAIVFSLHDHLLSFGSITSDKNGISTRPDTLSLTEIGQAHKDSTSQVDTEHSPVDKKMIASSTMSPSTQGTNRIAALTPKKNTPGNFTRDPKTGKALQERNVYALNVWRRVKTKLEGRDVDSSRRVAVSEQVSSIISEAISDENLCQLYEGWTPWV